MQHFPSLETIITGSQSHKAPEMGPRCPLRTSRGFHDMAHLVPVGPHVCLCGIQLPGIALAVVTGSLAP